MKRVLQWLWPKMPDQGVSDSERREVEIARQFAASADVLWYAGHRSVAIHHAERSLVHTLHLDQQIAEDPQAAEVDVTVSSVEQDVAAWIAHALGALGEADRNELLDAAKSLPQASVPVLDRDLSSRSGRYFRALVGVQQRRLNTHLPKLHTRLGVWMRRLRTLLFVLLVVVTLGYVTSRPAVPAEASASSSFSATYPASAVLDGKFDSRTHEWILPHSRKVGWLEVRFGSAQDIQHVRIKNASHPPHHTYGTKDFRLEVYKGGELVFKQEGSFSKPDVKSPWFTSKPIGKSADRIRVHVLSNYGPAGGLAEVEWE